MNRLVVFLVFVLCFVSHASADFVTIPQTFIPPSSSGSKWGNPIHGTASDVITWTFMADGTILSGGHPLTGEVSGGSNISQMRLDFDNANGIGAFDQAVNNAFNTWANATPGRITFQYVNSDTGADAGDSSNPSSYAVDIRIGAFTPVAATGFEGLAGVGFGPPGDDTFPFFHDALAGDILLNINQNFFVAPGNEGDTFYTTGTYFNDLEGLMLHELGHAAIGLAHATNGPNFSALEDVMYVDALPTFINRQLSAQDIAGAQSVYGVPEPGCVMILSIGLLGCLLNDRRRE
ncbi:MAG: hypothetical protein KDB03_01800 [Planctomycetales bacterium]|nr:hypothetical protein [Planctomycetales bacterium]